MKKAFNKEFGILFDEVVNIGFHKSSFQTSRNNKLSPKLRKKYLADLRTGSETEYNSALQLYHHQDKSPEFLEWLIECCERENYYLHQTLSFALLNFADDEKVLPALLESAKKAPNEDFANYAQLLGMFGGKEVLVILHERFNQIKDNPKTFEKTDFVNELAFTLEIICESILSNQPNNVDVAKALVSLTEHSCAFNREKAVRTIVSFYNHFSFRVSYKVSKIFSEKLRLLLKTKDKGVFLAAIPFLLIDKREKAYQKLKKIYLKTDSKKREQDIVMWLSKIEYHSAYWISRLVRELPEKETKPLQDALNSLFIKPMTEVEIYDSIRKDLADESPSKRISAIERFSYVSERNAQRLAKEAIKDEPEILIRTKLEKYLSNQATRRNHTQTNKRLLSQ